MLKSHENISFLQYSHLDRYLYPHCPLEAIIGPVNVIVPKASYGKINLGYDAVQLCKKCPNHFIITLRFEGVIR